MLLLERWQSKPTSLRFRQCYRQMAGQCRRQSVCCCWCCFIFHARPLASPSGKKRIAGSGREWQCCCRHCADWGCVHWCMGFGRCLGNTIVSCETQIFREDCKIQAEGEIKSFSVQQFFKIAGSKNFSFACGSLFTANHPKKQLLLLKKSLLFCKIS